MADEKYRTQLTGAQVDDALQQLNQRVAEGWAVGTRDGSPVGPGTEYYHNNAKYYAGISGQAVEDANAAAERAEAAVPAGTAGAVFFDRAQALTDTQKEQARKNIAAGGSNYNLLDNSWWGSGEVVNQRQVASGNTIDNVYCIDRWMTLYSGSGGRDGTYSLETNGITFTPAGTATVGFYQKIFPTLIIGKTYTASVMYSDGTVISGTAVHSSSNYNYISGANTDVIWNASANGLRVLARTTQTIRAVKLELGSFSTLANDTPPNYTDELIRCVSSTADPTDKYANKPYAPPSNRNLLDNGWFLVNQEGNTNVATAGTYVADRWYLYGDADNAYANQTEYGLQFTETATGGTVRIRQGFPDTKVRRELGKPITIGIKVDGEVMSLTGMLPTSVPSGQITIMSANIYTSTGKRCLAEVIWQANSNPPSMQVILRFFGAMTVTAVKLEIGAVSTLASDVAPEYDKELATCQRYCYVFSPLGSTYPSCGIALPFSTTSATYVMVTPVPMRTVPSIATVGSWRLMDGESNSRTLSSIQVLSAANQPGGNLVALQLTTSNLTVHRPYWLGGLSAGCKLILSAKM